MRCYINVQGLWKQPRWKTTPKTLSAFSTLYSHGHSWTEWFIAFIIRLTALLDSWKWLHQRTKQGWDQKCHLMTIAHILYDEWWNNWIWGPSSPSLNLQSCPCYSTRAPGLVHRFPWEGPLPQWSTWTQPLWPHDSSHTLLIARKWRWIWCAAYCTATLTCHRLHDTFHSIARIGPETKNCSVIEIPSGPDAFTISATLASSKEATACRLESSSQRFQKVLTIRNFRSEEDLILKIRWYDTQTQPADSILVCHPNIWPVVTWAPDRQPTIWPTI